MSKRYSGVLASLVEGLTAPQHPWRRANTRLLVANALFQMHEVATRHGKLAFVTTLERVGSPSPGAAPTKPAAQTRSSPGRPERQLILPCAPQKAVIPAFVRES